ncbi:MAG: hypothetical protein ABF491_08090, partial [Acetobacter sp.]
MSVFYSILLWNWNIDPGLFPIGNCPGCSSHSEKAEAKDITFSEQHASSFAFRTVSNFNAGPVSSIIPNFILNGLRPYKRPTPHKTGPNRPAETRTAGKLQYPVGQAH